MMTIMVYVYCPLSIGQWTVNIYHNNNFIFIITYGIIILNFYINISLTAYKINVKDI